MWRLVSVHSYFIESHDFQHSHNYSTTSVTFTGWNQKLLCVDKIKQYMHYSVCITDRKLGNNFLFFHLPESFLLSLGYSDIASYTSNDILCNAQCAFKFNVHIIEDIIFVASYIRRLSCTIHIFSTVNISIVKKSRKDEHVSIHHYFK